ncbi:hypothetical protein KIN20_036892 [Parelaphostrongylus tenuis]|uniref:Uncharacterized protein n=1 Tax=Parelaphostrongylus tenuis TaxID=148309 RepID=A0AAD5RD62_PARTN|nr:hypothetical protein KIN20_036892 [Parelaphostrongylus tenuis]
MGGLESPLRNLVTSQKSNTSSNNASYFLLRALLRVIKIYKSPPNTHSGMIEYNIFDNVVYMEKLEARTRI